MNYSEILALGHDDTVEAPDWDALGIADAFWSFDFIATEQEVHELAKLRMDLEEAVMGVGIGAIDKPNKVKLMRKGGFAWDYSISEGVDLPAYAANYNPLDARKLEIPDQLDGWNISVADDLPKKGKYYVVGTKMREDGRIAISIALFAEKRN